MTAINVRALYAAAGTNGDTSEPDEEDWEPVDLLELAGQIRRGELDPVLPAILQVEGALPLFYPGRINGLFGESGTLKTFVALAAIHHCATQGQRSLLIDYEDNPAGITERLIQLGFADYEIALVDYRNPSTGIGYGLEYLTEHVDGGDYHLIVIDSTGEAQAAGAVKGNADEENALWFALLKRVSRLLQGPAVLVLDHIPKDPDAPTGYAIGSQRKRAAITGASYRIDAIREPARGRDGKLKLTVAKDKPGNRAKGTIAAEIDVQTGPDGALTLHIHQSDMQTARDAGQKWRPTIYMERISTWLQFHPGSSQRAIRDGVEGKVNVLVDALEVLVEEGWVRVDAGPRGAQLHTNERLYTTLNDPVDNPTGSLVPTGSPLVPGTGETTGSHHPPPYGGGNQSTLKKPTAVDNPNGNQSTHPQILPREQF